MTIDPGWLSLTRVVERAKSKYGSDALATLKRKFEGGAIEAKAQRIYVDESSACYEFSAVQLPFLRVDPEFQRREQAAYDWAYGRKPPPDDGSVHIWPGEQMRFVWTGIFRSNELNDALLPLRDCVRVELRPLENALTLHRVSEGRGSVGPRRSRYRSHWIYRRYEAHGISCSEASVGSVFPYSTAFPPARPTGRPRKWLEQESFDRLEKIFSNGPSPSSKAQAMTSLLNAYADEGLHPSNNTIARHVALYLAKSDPKVI